MAVLRRSLILICVMLFLCGVVIPLILFIVTNEYDLVEKNSLSDVHGFDGQALPFHERKPLDFSETQVSENEEQSQVQELRQIVVSVRNELRHLEQQRTQLRKDVEMFRSTIGKVKKELSSTKFELQDSKGRLARTLREIKRVNEYSSQPQSTNSPVVVVNLPVENSRPLYQRNSSAEERFSCFDEICFGYSRCPLTQPFSVYVYNEHHSDIFDLKYPIAVSDFITGLQQTHSLTSDPNQACIFIIIVGPLKVKLDQASLRKRLESLSYWKDGSNHVVMELGYYNESLNTHLKSLPLGHCIRVTGYSTNTETKGYNILLPPVTKFDNEPSWKGLPHFLPAIRDTLLFFEGAITKYDESKLSSQFGTWINERYLMSLKQAITDNSVDKVLIKTRCSNIIIMKTDQSFGEWSLCGTPQQRASNLTRATFTLIIGSRSGLIGPMTYTRLIEALRYGAIPVIVGIRHLPFDSVIDWTKATVILSSTTLGQLHYLLKNIDSSAILNYRRQGRFLWDTYFSSSNSIMNTVVAIIRQRALHPPAPASDWVATITIANIPGENRILPSEKFVSNFTSYSYKLWNSPPGPFFMYPVTPFKPSPISGSKYVGLNKKEISILPNHILTAGGITGPHFEDFLLGDAPEEQFTVVMLTYERENVLVEAIDRLRDLDHLSKVVVVWNSQNSPSASLKWPEIGVPIDVVSVGRNSLNNRFLPFSNINTEAVLSIDDDVHLRHDEIQFAFRVWREARDRIVGFPGRFHAWDTRHAGWLYNSNYTCELSMVLTGAAFLHKYYMYVYSHWLFPEVRQLVDQYINCEDIAMNFLVSHITRKPPLKVTSRWTFRCPGCPETLSSSDGHFKERHICMNKLVDIFGYMPLLYTQFRLDSVLFKTRLPSHLEKCYEFI